MQTIEEYAMEHGLSFEEAQRQLDASEPPLEQGEEEGAKTRRKRKAVEE